MCLTSHQIVLKLEHSFCLGLTSKVNVGKRSCFFINMNWKKFCRLLRKWLIRVISRFDSKNCLAAICVELQTYLLCSQT